jgi:Ca-activated chloride channel family protein
MNTTSPRPRAALSRAILLTLLFVPALAAAPQAPTPQASTKPAPGRAQEPPRIRVDVNLVNVLASVLDKDGRPVAGLPQDAFEIYEEGVRQKIQLFEPETQQPLDLALMIDASMSTLKELGFEKEAAAHFIRQIVRPTDRLAVFEFSDDIAQLTDFSHDVPHLQSAVRGIMPGSGTALYDAVFLGAQALARLRGERRKVIILVTDAGETTSRADFDSARRAALRGEALLYTIVIRPVKNESGRNTAGEHALETIADTTGGAMYFPDTEPQLDAIFDQINRELRTQYRLGYYPEPMPPPRSFRKIEVRVKGEEYVLHVRKGYYTSVTVE